MQLVSYFRHICLIEKCSSVHDVKRKSKIHSMVLLKQLKTSKFDLSIKRTNNNYFFDFIIIETAANRQFTCIFVKQFSSSIFSSQVLISRVARHRKIEKVSQSFIFDFDLARNLRLLIHIYFGSVPDRVTNDKEFHN